MTESSITSVVFIMENHTAGIELSQFLLQPSGAQPKMGVVQRRVAPG